MRGWLRWVLVVMLGASCASPEDPDGGQGDTVNDTGPRDATGSTDLGPQDLGFNDGSLEDGGLVTDAAPPVDAGDTGPADLGAPDGASTDATPTDATPTDATPTDAEPADAEPTDAEPTDAEPTDATPGDVGSPPSGCVPDPAAQVPPSPGLLARADSIVGYSGIQGQCGWRYLYFEVASGQLIEMSAWNPNNQVWYADANLYWTQHQRDLAHPNGVTTSGGRMPVDHYAVRRWVSDLSGPVVIAGVVRKSPGGLGGNGVAARVLQDGQVLLDRVIGGTDGVGVDFTLTTTVAVGASIDLVLDPFQSHDLSDATRVELRVWHR